MTKMTYAEALRSTIAVVTDEQVHDRLLTSIEKRNSGERKPTKTQVANEGLKGVVLSALTSDPCTVSELMTRSDELSALSNQKVSALVNALVREGRVIKVPDGRKTTFCLAE